MDKILVDTNIVLDLLARREPFFQDAQRLFSKADKGKIQLSVASLSIVNTHYILKSRLKLQEARKYLRQLKVLVEVLPMTDKIIDLALDSDFKDFEDAIQYYIALENNLDFILSRNQKDFKTAAIPVMTCSDYLNAQ